MKFGARLRGDLCNLRTTDAEVSRQPAAQSQSVIGVCCVCTVRAAPRANPTPISGWSLGWVAALDLEGRTIWIVDAHRGDCQRFIVRADEKLSAFVELERQVLTVTFYLESIRSDPCVDQ